MLAWRGFFLWNRPVDTPFTNWMKHGVIAGIRSNPPNHLQNLMISRM